MEQAISESTLINLGLDPQTAKQIQNTVNAPAAKHHPETTWEMLTQILKPSHPFQVHLYLYQWVYRQRDPIQQPGPTWFPKNTEHTHIGQAQKALSLPNYKALHQWSTQHREDYWAYAIRQLSIQFKTPYQTLMNLEQGLESPIWFEGATLNIVDSCFQAPPHHTAITYQEEGSNIQQVSYQALQSLVARVANSLRQLGFQPGDAIAIDMPMTVEAVAIYLGVVAAGCAVVAIADSFAPPEIAMRLEIANTKAIFTQDSFVRHGKTIPLYQKVIDANAPQAIVLVDTTTTTPMRKDDLRFDDFLVQDDTYRSTACTPEQSSNILFSSGTTGTPKAIPWDHTTPIKAAADAYFHHDVHPNDCIAWPTNLGWMMGPWLIYASLINQASLGLYYGVPTGRAFCKFVEGAKISLLGIVPSMVKAWRQTECLDGLNWKHLKAFSSTGESSNAEDMLYLMSRCHYRPILEYCGGTEIGGAYITSTLVEPNIPSTFSTPTLGLDLVLLDDNEAPCQKGEVALLPPSIGLSRTLLNKDHYNEYFQDMPNTSEGTPLRRHGDEMERLKNGYYRALGRVDDTMNLGGIKVSSAELERALLDIEGILETAAIAISPPTGGPSAVVIYAVPQTNEKMPDEPALKLQMQQAIARKLNPLFKIKDVVLVENLPRTSSNKIMRRVLRDRYQANPSN